MRIAIFSDTYFPQVNGVSKYVDEMQKYMEDNSIEYRLFVPNTDREMINITSFNGIPVVFYPELQISWPSRTRIKSVLDKFQPDFIYLATPLSIGIAGLKYARSNSIPIVATYHTNFPQYLRYYRLGSVQGAVWKYLQWFHSFSQINCCPSLETMEDLLLHGIGKITLCNNGIDCAAFSPASRSDTVRKHYAPQGEILLLYVGRIAREKDIEVLIRASELLRDKQVAYKLLMVGDGPDLKALQARDIANTVFAGYKSGRELQAIYASADIFVFPSVTETFGNVILEAMASGLPVIAAYSGGVTESLRDMSNGLGFTPGDAKEMADCIVRLTEDGKLRSHLALNARSFALKRSWDSTFSRFFASCRKIIPERRPASETSDKIA